MAEKHDALVRAAGIPVFTCAEEEARFWGAHSPLDYPEYWADGEELWLGGEKAIRMLTYRPDLGNIPLPFPTIPISCSGEPDPSA